MTRQNAGNAGQAAGLMKQVEQFVAQSNDSIAKLSASMQEITRASEETQKIVKTIDETSLPRKGRQDRAASGPAGDRAPAGRGPVAPARAKQAPAPKAAARKRPDPKRIIPLETEDFWDF